MHVADMNIFMVMELVICLPASRVEAVMMSLRDAVSMSNGAARSSPVSKACRQEAKMMYAHLSISTPRSTTTSPDLSQNGSIQGVSNVPDALGEFRTES